jgi:hypothetical protein
MGLSCATNGAAGILAGEIYQQQLQQMDLHTVVMRCVVPFQGLHHFMYGLLESATTRK